MEELQLNDDLLALIIDYARSRGYSYRTLKLYKNELTNIFNKYDTLDNKKIKTILDKSKNTYKRAVINLIIKACEYNDVDMPKFKIISTIKKPRKIPETLTRNEIRIAIDSIKDDNHKLFIKCIYSIGAGLRVSEIIKLKWSNIAWAEWLEDRGVGVITIENTKRNKTFKVPVPKEIMEELYKKAEWEGLLNEFGIPTGFLIFCFVKDIYTWEKSLRLLSIDDWIDKYIIHSYSYIRYNIIQKCCEPALNKRVKIHSLRHSKATYLLDIGVPIEEISELLGHSDIRTSMIYAKVNPKKTIKRFENIEPL